MSMMKKDTGITRKHLMPLIMILLLTVALSGCTGSAGADGYYDFGNDRIPSLEKVVGKRTVVSEYAFGPLDDGTQSLTISYSSDPDDEKKAADDIEKYVRHLLEKENFTMYNAEGWYSLGENTACNFVKESADRDMMINLHISYGPQEYWMQISKTSSVMPEMPDKNT